MNAPKLIVVGGSLATGKTTIAAKLEAAAGVKRVSMDGIKEALFDVCGYRDREWSKRVGRLAFEVFKDAIAMHLEHGESVVAEATFIWPSDADWLHEFADRHGAELIQIWVTADPRVARERFVARSGADRHCGHCDALDSVLEEFDRRYFNRSFIPLPIRARTLVVDTTDFDAVDPNAITGFVMPNDG